MPIADCRDADCRDVVMPIADCRLPIADCRDADCRDADCRQPIAVMPCVATKND